MAMENKRIIQLSTERLNLTSGDYVMVDDENNGSAKYRLDRLKETDTTLSVSGKAADAAATGQAISDEAEARDNADNALGEDIGDLKSALTSETNARILLTGRVTMAEGDIDTLNTHKVAQPLNETISLQMAQAVNHSEQKEMELQSGRMLVCLRMHRQHKPFQIG